MVQGNGGGRTEHRRDNPRGSSGTLATPREAKGGKTNGGRGGRNRLAARGFRGKEGPGKQVEGVKTASAGTGNG